MGAKEEEAFFVTCDRATMTEDDILNGRLICEYELSRLIAVGKISGQVRYGPPTT